MGDDRPAVYREGTNIIYRASALGECARALLAVYDGVKPRRKAAMTELLELTAEEGNLHETGVVTMLQKKMGYELIESQSEVEIPVVPGVLIRGHTDARMFYERPLLIEVKSKSDKQFEIWMKLKWEAFENHAAQVTAYMRAFPDHDVVFVVKRRSDGKTDMTYLLADQPPMDWNRIRAKILTVEVARRNGTTPACDLAANRRWMCPMWFLHDEPDVESLDMTADMKVIAEELLKRRGPIKAIEAEGKDAEKERKEIDGQLMNLLGDADRFETDGWVVTRTGSSTPKWDEEGLKAEYGDGVTKYRVSKRYEYLNVREKKGQK